MSVHDNTEIKCDKSGKISNIFTLTPSFRGNFIIVIRKSKKVAPRSRLTEMEDIERDFIYSETTN